MSTPWWCLLGSSKVSVKLNSSTLYSNSSSWLWTWTLVALVRSTLACAAVALTYASKRRIHLMHQNAGFIWCIGERNLGRIMCIHFQNPSLHTGCCWWFFSRFQSCWTTVVVALVRVGSWCALERSCLRLLDYILLHNPLSVLFIDHTKAQTVMTHSVYACGSAVHMCKWETGGNFKDAGNFKTRFQIVFIQDAVSYDWNYSPTTNTV